MSIARELSIKAFALSDMGQKRKNNEDAVLILPDVGLFCVADGMGGGEDGEVASSTIVRALQEETANFFGSKTMSVAWADGVLGVVQSAIKKASSLIYSHAQGKNLKCCGSTFVALCMNPYNPSKGYVLHAGDSRVYRIRDGEILQLTKDHSVADMMGVEDEREINPLFRGMILRAVGVAPKVEIEKTSIDIEPGDRFLLCSDGLTRMVSNADILGLSKYSATMEVAARAWIKAANDAGGEDNISVVVVDVESPAPESQQVKGAFASRRSKLLDYFLRFLHLR